jgi:PAS domain S-box-containing protein
MISVLYVDSDPRLQADLKEYLERDNRMRVETLSSATDALDLVKTKKFDAIVSEYYLSVTDGQTFLEVLRRARNNPIPFIFFAKKAGNEAVIKALNLGATFYVLKGKNPEHEFEVLRHFIFQAVEQKRLTEALKESEKQYRLVVEGQSEFIMRFLPDGTMIFVNEAYCRYFEVPRDKILQQNIFDTIPAERRNDFSSHIRKLTPEHPESTADSHFLNGDGKVRWQRWQNRAIFNDAGKLIEYLAVGRDITGQKNAENALVVAHNNLGIMNTITRHDILNQLTGVFNLLELSLLSSKEPEVLEFLNKAIAAAETIRTQILFTQDYQDIGVGAAQWQNIDALIRKSIDALDLSGIDIRYSLRDLWVFADPLVEKVFYNLLENSLRHGNGVSAIQISNHECESGLTIVYEDNGIGIPEEAKEKIFRREYFQNTGLGLYLIRQILAITHIKIRETGTPGKGVRFEISVPPGKYGIRVASREDSAETIKIKNEFE